MILFKPVLCSENEKSVRFEAFEDEICIGNCLMIIDGISAEIVSLSFDENKIYAFEGLVKSAFNYACLKNCYMGYVSAEGSSYLLEKMGFQNENGVYFNDIPSILQGNCCKNKS